MRHKLFATEDSATTSLLRLVLGVVFFAHGAQKILGWFGGPGFSGTMDFFTGYLHIPHRSPSLRFEYHLLALAITAFLMIRGAGAFSLDRVVATASPTVQPSLAHS